MNYSFLTRKKLFFLSLSLLAGLFACTRIPPQATAPSFTPAPVQEAAVTVSSITPPPSSSPAPTDTPSPAPTPFSLVLMGDTQGLSYSYPEALEATGAYIAQRIESESIAAVLHAGDLVDNGFKDWQWDNFYLALNQFEGKVPFYPVAGNHDLGTSAQSFTAFLDQGLYDFLPEEQLFEGGKLFYDILEAGGCRFLLLGMGWMANRLPGAEQWLDTVMDAYKDLPCILLLHAYISRQLTVPANHYNRVHLVSRYPNIRLVLCGHNRACGIVTEYFDDDGDGTAERPVTAVMLDYQEMAGVSPLLFLHFDPLSHEIRISFELAYKRSTMTNCPIPDLDGTVLKNIF